MSKLLQGGSPYGSTENDPGAQNGPSEGGQIPSEADVVRASEKDLPGSKTERGFNPTAK